MTFQRTQRTSPSRQAVHGWAAPRRLSSIWPCRRRERHQLPHSSPPRRPQPPPRHLPSQAPCPCCFCHCPHGSMPSVCQDLTSGKTKTTTPLLLRPTSRQPKSASGGTTARKQTHREGNDGGFRGACVVLGSDPEEGHLWRTRHGSVAAVGRVAIVQKLRTQQEACTVHTSSNALD